MNKKYIFIGILLLLMVVMFLIMLSNSKKTNSKKKNDEINARFNAIKSAPIAFKLNKAQAMAKRNEAAQSEVNAYYEKYEETQKHIDSVQNLINKYEDAVAFKKKNEAKETLVLVEENLSDLENEIRDIEKFLDKFQQEETEIREYSLKLKEDFRDLKLYINDNMTSFAYANNGIEERLSKCEKLFSSSEEWMYINYFSKAKADLDSIQEEMQDMRAVFMELPSLIQEAKGILPVLIDEVEKGYASAKQRGIYVKHLRISEKLDKIKMNLNGDLKSLLGANIDDVKEHSVESKETLEKILTELEKERTAYDESRVVIEKIKTNLENLYRLETYVSKGFEQEKERFGLQDFKPYLTETKKKIKQFEKDYQKLSDNLLECKAASTTILTSANKLYYDSEIERKGLMSYKLKIDQTSSDEQRATTQLRKLQVVINELEIKVKEYRIPTISSNYYDDLDKAKNYVSELKGLLEEIPLNIERLNLVLDESIDFVYTFYNNVNNIVGMAIMVENAIVFGNKYRSSYPEVDRELSKAEFSYLNGEYTKALTIAITCMETLFPNVADENFLENA